MENKINFQDDRIRLYLIIARVFGLLITGIYILFMVPEFISLLTSKNSNSEEWVFIFYAISMLYGLAYLLTFWNIVTGAVLLISSSLLITIYAFIDTRSWMVCFLFIPLSFAGFLFLIYWRKYRKSKS